MINKLAPKEIIFNVHLNKNYKNIKFEDLKEISESYKNINKAINIENSGYNLYLVDTYSRQRIENIKNVIEEIYKSKKSPRDMCLCTLPDIQKPINITMSRGKGKLLREYIERIKNNYYKIAIDFYTESYDNSEKDRLLQEIEKKREEHIDKLITISSEEGFEVKASKEGFAFVPVLDDKEMTESEYDELSDDEKSTITEGALNLRKRVQDTLEKIREIEDKYNDKLREILSEYLDIKMQEDKESAFIDFIDEIEVLEYIEEVCKKIESELVKNYNSSEEYEAEKEINAILNKYTVSILIDNSENMYPRVIYEEEPSINNLFGNIEYENDNGVYTANLSSVYPGSLLKANDGCIILRLNSLIDNPLCYNFLIKALLKGKINIEGNKNYLDLLSINGLKVEDIPINTKVILIGNLEFYNILYNADEDFRNLFKIKCEYPKEVKMDNNIVSYIMSYISKKSSSLGTLKLDDAAIMEIVKYLSRATQDRNKINIELDRIDKIILLSNEEAKLYNKTLISRDEVIKTIYDDELYSDKIIEYYKQNKVLISFSGARVGSVNGLAVIDTGYFCSGKVMRITGICCKGTGKIVDTQKESSMSGKIHEKSLSILSGIIQNMSDRHKKIQVDFHLSFEQVYGEIDGDSASVAEMICMLSVLSNIPVKQYIAVTGSLNQFKEVQPIGGVNEKIEGFFKMTEINGIKKSCVLIPSLNKDEIVLKSEVEEAVKKSKFSIYTMDNLDDAIEVLLLDNGMTIKEFWNIISKELDKYC